MLVYVLKALCNAKNDKQIVYKQELHCLTLIISFKKYVLWCLRLNNNKNLIFYLRN